MSQRHNYELVKIIIRKKCDIDWNDLADTNSIHSYISEDEMTEEQLNIAAKDAMSDRLLEDELSSMAGITINDIWHDDR